MSSRHSLGATVRLYLDVVTAGAGVISQTPTIAIRRVADDYWFQASDGTWQSTVVQNAMAQLDAVNLPGRYYFDFDQSLDEEEGSVTYIVRKTNLGGSARTEYEDLVFGPLAGAAALQLCSVQGTIFTPDGIAVRNAMVQATLVPSFLDAQGRSVQSERVMTTYTNAQGEFDLPLVRGGVFRLQVLAVGFDRKVTIPDATSVLFTAL
jgi:hypothetical protein